MVEIAEASESNEEVLEVPNPQLEPPAPKREVVILDDSEDEEDGAPAEETPQALHKRKVAAEREGEWIDVSEDGKVRKFIIDKGTGTECPQVLTRVYGTVLTAPHHTTRTHTTKQQSTINNQPHTSPSPS
jgi:hypothetical protein